MSAGLRREARRLKALRRQGVAVCDLDCATCTRAVCTGARELGEKDEGGGMKDEGGGMGERDIRVAG